MLKFAASTRQPPSPILVEIDLNEIQIQIQRAKNGDSPAFEFLFAHYRSRLERLIELRIDRRIMARLDVADILQEVHLAGIQQIQGFVQQENVPFYIWMRAIALNKLHELHRHHLSTQKRSATREASLTIEF